MQQFSKKEAILFGWNTAKSNIGYFLKIFGLLVVVLFIPNTVGSVFAEEYSIVAFGASLIIAAVSFIIAPGIIKIALDLVDGKKPPVRELFAHYRLVGKYLAGSVLYGLIVFGGFLLFIVPGIIWGIKYQFFTYFIVDKNMGPLEALHASGRITKGAKWNLLLFGFLLWLVNVAGMLAFGVGLLWSVPTSWIATAWVYRKLLAQEGKTV